MLAISLDGGGVRGVVTLRVLLELEARVGGASLATRSALIAGASTGAMIACGIALGTPIAEVLGFYRALGAYVFEEGPTPALERLWAPAYGTGSLRQALTRLFGDRPFGELGMRPGVMIPIRNWTRRRTELAKSWEPRWADVPIVQVLLAATAAPTFFRPHHLRGDQLCDGGIAANHPADCALAELVDAEGAFRARADDVRVVSVGTGELRRDAPSDSAADWGVLGWAPHLFDEAMGAPIDLVDGRLRRHLGPGYARVQPELPEYVVLDDAGRIEELEVWTETWLEGDGKAALEAAALVVTARAS